VQLQTSVPLLRADVDVHTMPSVLQQSSDVPDTDVRLRLGVMRRVGRLGRYLNTLAGLCRCWKWHDCFPDGPRPLAAVWLRLGVKTGGMPRVTAVDRHVDPLDAATTATHCIAAHRHLTVLDVDRCTVEWTTDCRLYWILLDRHHLHIQIHTAYTHSVAKIQHRNQKNSVRESTVTIRWSTVKTAVGTVRKQVLR